jgi:hypothetical protein
MPDRDRKTQRRTLVSVLIALMNVSALGASGVAAHPCRGG